MHPNPNKVVALYKRVFAALLMGGLGAIAGIVVWVSTSLTVGVSISLCAAAGVLIGVLIPRMVLSVAEYVVFWHDW